ncbi:DNA cytosine methyltransferase [Myxococcus sp. AS-1-15]|uniref:DNA cytosine methyltransferase n=1 Tax=Myxococcus sp. AS-1-15 TaxID=2874600 RepID=UPI001CBC03EE|nr:DNA cytosine methyltransferase [Myxococcus sp. AS-1-15]MBZ4395144.1 DNA cytosine methyltransferase [Myxococcus sp. AS-1-15]
MTDQGLIIDLFAGGGGAGTGIAAAVGREPDIALNHDPVAMAVYKANHTTTICRPENVWKTPPRQVVALAKRRGKRVWILWASPDCTHFSKAKGAKPRRKDIRSLAFVVTHYARDVEPQFIFLENVEEFVDWGPLYTVGYVMPDGRVLKEGDQLIDMPIPERAGEDFQRFVGELRLIGYSVDWRLITASEHGAPTKRKRLFLVARRDGLPVSWPAPTHGPGLLPVRTAAECIDWSIPVQSIFGRRKPLVPNTLRRVAQGIRKYVFENPAPFVLTIDQQSTRDTARPVDEPLSTIVTKARHALVAPTLIQVGYGERKGQAARTLDLHAPLGTIMAQGRKHALVSAFLREHRLAASFVAKGYGGHASPGIRVDGPLDTITTQDHHHLAAVAFERPEAAAPNHVSEVRAFLSAYYGEGSEGQRLTEPLRTITTKARLGLVTVASVDYQLVDIGLRMLEPSELLRAQFGDHAEGYDLSAATSKADKVRLIGNSVCPDAAAAVVRANVGGAAVRRRAA